MELMTQHGNRFVDSLCCTPDQMAEVKEIWARRLLDLTQEEIEKGLNDSMNCRFPPSLAEFKKLCRPDQEEVPPNSKMYRDAVPLLRQQCSKTPEEIKQLLDSFANKLTENTK